MNETTLMNDHLRASRTCRQDDIGLVDGRQVCRCGWQTEFEIEPVPVTGFSPEEEARLVPRKEFSLEDVRDIFEMLSTVTTPESLPGDYKAYIDDNDPEAGVGIFREDGTPILLMPLDVYRVLNRETGHAARVKASIARALDEHATTLTKLAIAEAEEKT